MLDENTCLGGGGDNNHTKERHIVRGRKRDDQPSEEKTARGRRSFSRLWIKSDSELIDARIGGGSFTKAQRKEVMRNSQPGEARRKLSHSPSAFDQKETGGNMTSSRKVRELRKIAKNLGSKGNQDHLGHPAREKITNFRKWEGKKRKTSKYQTEQRADRTI